MAFDTQAARKAGYSDDEIADYLSSQSGFDAAAARKAGYSSGEIIQAISTRTTQPANDAKPDQGLTPLDTEQVTSARPWQGAGAGRGSPNDPRRVDVERKPETFERPGFAAGFYKGLAESERPLTPGGLLLRAADAFTGGAAQDRYNKAQASVLDDKTSPALAADFAKPTQPAKRPAVLEPRTDTISPTGGVVDALKDVPVNTLRSAGSTLMNFGALAAEAGLTIQSAEQFRKKAAELDKDKARTGLGVSDEPLMKTGTAVDALIPSAKTIADYAPEGLKQLGMIAAMGPGAIVADAGARGVSKAREDGLSLAPALLYGAGQAVTEGVPEALSAKFAIEAAKKIPLASALRGDAKSVTTAFQQTAQTMGVELGSEQASALGNWVVDKIAADPTATPDRLVTDLQEAVKATIVQGPTMLAGAKAAQAAASGLAARPEDRAARALADTLNSGEFDRPQVETLNPNLAIQRKTQDGLINIGAAQTVDEAIAAATQATSPQDRAVDNIARILGETPNVSQPGDVRPPDSGTPRLGAPEPGIGLEAGMGTDGAAGRPMDAGGAGNQPDGGTVPLADRGPDAQLSPEPASMWFGRRGDGYQTPEDASAALPSRQKIAPDLSWKVEQMPSGRYRLAGYDTQAQQPAPAFQVKLNPTGTATIIGDPAAIKATLAQAGIDKVMTGTDRVVVGTSQAQAAVQALEQKQPLALVNTAQRAIDFVANDQDNQTREDAQAQAPTVETPAPEGSDAPGAAAKPATAGTGVGVEAAGVEPAKAQTNRTEYVAEVRRQLGDLQPGDVLENDMGDKWTVDVVMRNKAGEVTGFLPREGNPETGEREVLDLDAAGSVLLPTPYLDASGNRKLSQPGKVNRAQPATPAEPQTEVPAEGAAAVEAAGVGDTGANEQSDHYTKPHAKQTLLDRLESGRAPFIDSSTLGGKKVWYAKGIGTTDTEMALPLNLTEDERKAARRAESNIELADNQEERNAAREELAAVLTPAARRAALAPTNPPKQEAAGVGQAGFDPVAFDKARSETIQKSREAGNIHLDKVPPYVETMRGKKVYYAHDPKVRGTIRTVDNRGTVYVNWDDQYSAEKEMASPTQDGKKTVMQSGIGPRDLKDYVLATNPPKQDQTGGTPDVGAGVSQPMPVAAPDPRLTPVSKREQTGGFESLLSLKSTKLILDDGQGRKLYEVQVTPAFRNKHFVNGRMPVSSGLELKHKADVTGVPSDNGWVLIDSREQLASRNLPKKEAEQNTSAESEQVGPYGRDLTPIAQGGKPFKTKAEADKFRTSTSNTLKTVRSPTGKGFAVKEKSAAEILRAEKAAKRLSQPNTGTAGEPLHAHGFIAAEGGLSKAAMKDAGFDRNKRVGNRWMFSDTGMTIERATEKLIEAGYLRDGASHSDAFTLLDRSANQAPQYTPEGWERMAEAEQEARRLAAQDEANADAQDFAKTAKMLGESGLDELDYAVDNMPELFEAGARLTAEEADAIFEEHDANNESAVIEGDQELEQADARAAPPSRGQGDRAPGRTQEGQGNAEETGITSEQLAAAQDELRILRGYANQRLIPTNTTLREVITSPLVGADRAINVNAKRYGIARALGLKVERIRQPRSDALVLKIVEGDTPLLDKTVAEIAAMKFILQSEKQDQPSPALREPLSKQEQKDNETGLTAPTQADVLAQQDRAVQAEELDQRAQIDREASGFQLQTQTAEQRRENTGDMFGGPSVEDYQSAVERNRKPGTAPEGPDLFGGLTEQEATSEEQRIENLRKQLVDVEDKIVGAAGMAPGFIEDAMKSRKVPKEQKDRRNDLKAELRAARQRLSEQTAEPAKPAAEMSAAELLRAAADKMDGKAAEKKPADKIDDIGEKIGGARKDTAVSTGARKKAVSEEDDRPTWAKRFRVAQVAGGFDMQVNGRDITGKWTLSDTRTVDRLGQPKRIGGYFDSKEEAEAALPLLALAQKHRAVPVNTTDGQKYEIWRDINDRKRVKVVDRQFDTRDEAMRYMAQNAVQILETNTTFGEADLPKPESTQRIGVERRAGDVKGEDFRDTFGFRGVEFGLWNNQDERQEVMNAAYDGLLDLAEVLKVPPKAIGLNGDLALAFGARGKGLSGARAHYETDRVVMNLTKMNGAGALAHEWFHALDHYLARQDGKTTAEWKINKDGTRSLDVKGGESDMASSGFRRNNSGVREELRNAYTDLVQSLFTKAEQYVEDTARADKFVAVARGELEKDLSDLRKDLSEQKDVRYYKRNNKPASAEQLAEFDAMAAELVDGRGLSTEWKVMPGKSRSSIQTRHTNETLEKLNELYKAVRGRSGFNTERRGVLDSLVGYMTRYEQRLKMLSEATALTPKTKRVPTSFAMDAKSLDQGRGGDYWTSPHEMVARAFQGYVEDAIAANEGRSPFLNYAPENAGILTPWGAKRPFPAGDERKAMNAEFDKFIDVLQTRETDDGNVAMFSRTPAWRSDLRDKVAAIKMESSKEEGWRAYISGLTTKGVKPDEIEWSGVTDWLKLQTGKVTKQQVLDYLDGNGVQVQEVVLGAQSNAEADKAMEKWGIVVSRNPEDENQVAFLDRDNPDDLMTADELESAGYPIAAVRAAMEIESGGVAVGATGFPKYSQYTLPGGTNYREVLLTLPSKVAPPDFSNWKSKYVGGGEWEVHDADRKFRGLVRADSEATQEQVGKAWWEGASSNTQRMLDSTKADYRSSHWDTPNVLAHIRLNDRTDADGKRVLFVEEIQSDWGQEGKKKGFAPRDIANPTDAEVREFFGLVPGADPADFRQEMVEALQKRNRAGTLPAAPFVTSTDKWLTLALKRVITMASQEGYDKVAFVNGEQSAQRYSLSKQVDSVSWESTRTDGAAKNVTLNMPTGKPIRLRVDGDGSVLAANGPGFVQFEGKQLDDIIGKDLAKKIMGETTNGSLSGVGLDIGGEGMKAFYDKIIPNTLKDVLKKVGGGGLEAVSIGGATNEYDYFASQQGGFSVINGKDEVIARFQTPEEAAREVDRLQAKTRQQQPGFTITDTIREKAAQGLPMFRAGDESNGMALDKAQAIVKDLTKKWKNGPPVFTVATPKDLPVPAPSDANGMYFKGQLWIVAGAHKTRADIARTLAHEAIAHYGLRNILGADEWRRFMANIQLAIKSGNKPLKDIQARVRRAYVDGQGRFNLTPNQEADEIAAKVVEDAIGPDGEFRPGFGFVKSVYARIVEFLRDLGLDVKLTMAEVQGMLVLAQRNLEAGRRTGGGGEVVVAASMRALDKFSRGAQQQANTAVQSTVDKLTADWQNKPEIVIAFDMQDEAIPENVRLEDAKQRSGGAFGNPEGFYYRGVVYLLSSQLATDADIARVLAHESLGHYGLRGLYGKALKPILQQVVTMRRADVIAVARQRGLVKVDGNNRPIVDVKTATNAQVWAAMTDSHKSQSAEEVLAEMAQTTPQAGFVKRAVAAIRQWLREHGFNLKLTDNDIIVNYILPARGFVERGSVAGGMLGVPAFARVWHGSPHKFLQFDSSKIGTGEGAQAYGHGLYLAESKGVAGSYQESLSTDPERFLVDGEEVFRRQANGPAFDVSDPKTAAIFYAARKGDKAAREYFAEQGAWGGKAIAELDAMKGKAISRVAPGNLYQVDLPDDQIAKMLDWDKPLSQQAPEVRAMAEAALRSAKRSKSDIDWLMDKPGAQLENFLMPSGNRSEASQRLSEAGIPGIRYLDGGSRGAGAGTYNYVIFPGNEHLLTILDINGVPVGQEVKDQVIGDAINEQEKTGGAAFSRSDQTQTDAFKRWFGDSKVVDADGKPLVVYHSSTFGDFSTFDKAKQHKGMAGYGFYFSDADGANIYADYGANFQADKDWQGNEKKLNIMPVYLAIQNPLVADNIAEVRARFGKADPGNFGQGRKYGGMSETAQTAIQRAGYDGVIANEYVARQKDGSYKVVEPSAKGAIKHPVYVAFEPSQIKSATGNRGTFDRKDPDIRFSRGAVEEAPEQPPRPNMLARAVGYQSLDDAGSPEFTPGRMLYNLIGDATGPLLSKWSLKAASPELRTIMRAMKIDVAKAQETAAAVAKESMALSQEEREMVSDLIEKELRAGVVPPEHAIRLAATINTVMGKQTDELLQLGMLSRESAERWRGEYLPRFYESKLTKQADDLWADAMRKLRGNGKPLKGIRGKHLRGRGMYETIPVTQLADYETMGWEVRDPDYQPGLTDDGMVQVWRDFTRQERDKMGEIRDAGFRFVMGYMQTQKDIALGRMFEALATNPEMSSKTATEELSVHVPTGTAPGTEVKTYGKLAGRYVSPETLSQLSMIEEAQSEALMMYRKAMGLWKESKTVLNPVAHANNVISNITMAHFAGVSYGRVDKYLAAVRDFATKSDDVLEAKDAGLFLGTMNEAELFNTLPEELKALAQTQEGTATKIGRSAFNLLSFYLRKPMGWAYQAEDTFFRYLIYKDARGRGLSPDDAVDYAQKFIFTYDDLPKGARLIRDFGIPFFAYTYKAIPALLETALTHPERFAAPMAVIMAANAVAYAIAAGDDDDSWELKLKKYLNDPEYRKEAKAKEQLERELLPEWLKGKTALGTDKTVRLGTDELTKLPMFLDMSRMIPGGDLLDVRPNSGGIPWPQPLTPNHPLLAMTTAIFANKDTFYGKDIVNERTDTAEEAARKRMDWMWKQMTPAIAYGNYHWERWMNALAQATGKEVQWAPEWATDKAIATGIGRDGLPVQPKLAAMQTFGIKARPYDLDKAEEIQRSMTNKDVREIEAEMRSLRRLMDLGAVSDRTYDRKREAADEKKERLRDGQTVDGKPR